MTEWSGPWDGEDFALGDDRWQRYWRALICGGVIGDPVGPSLLVAVNESATGWTVQPGEVWSRGRYFGRPDADGPATLSPATPDSNPRLDRVVVRFDRAAKEATLHVIEGTPAASPVLPDLATDLDGTFDVPLAYSRVRTAAPVVSQLVDDRRFLGMDVLPATSTTRPPTSRMGQLLHEADTGRLRQWNGSQWVAPWAVDLGQSLTFGPLAQATTASNEWVQGGPQGTFVAPASGKVWIKLSAFLNNNTVALTLFGFELYNGTSVTASARRLEASGGRALTVGGGARARMTHDVLVEGLTPGAPYTVLGCRQVTGGIGTYDYRQIAVQPTT